MGPVVDLELLADYAAGVLDPAAAARVSRLIAAEPVWAQTYEQLIAADRAIQERLRAVAAADAGSVDVMPTDVAATIDHTLRQLASRPRLVPGGDGSGARHRAKAGRGVAGRGVAGRGVAGRGVAGRAAAGRAVAGRFGAQRSRRIAAMSSLVAASIVVVFGAVTVAGRLLPAMTSPADLGAKAESASDGGRGTVPPAAPNTPPTAQVVSTGTDYQPQTLPQLIQLASGLGVPLSATGDRSYGPEITEVPGPVRDGVAPPLRPLTDAATLTGCLGAIGQTHPGTPVLLDYASFTGTPALVVLLVDQSGTAVVVVGGSCTAASSNELYAQRVG